MSSLPAPEIITLGCRLNIAESETIRGLLAGRDVTVVNSCAVTNEAVKQTRDAIRRARRARPQARLVVTGCAARIDPAGFAAMPEVDRVVANDDKLDPAAVGRQSRPRPAPRIGRRLRQPRPRVRRCAERLRPRLHLLRDPGRARREPLDTGRGGGRAHRGAGRRRATRKSS